MKVIILFIFANLIIRSLLIIILYLSNNNLTFVVFVTAVSKKIFYPHY